MGKKLDMSFFYMDVSENSGKTPKMDGENNGTPYYNGWFGGTFIFGNTHIFFGSISISIQFPYAPIPFAMERIVPKHHLTGYLENKGLMAIGSQNFWKKLFISLYLLENETDVDIQPKWKVNWHYLKYISALSFPSQEGK